MKNKIIFKIILAVLMLIVVSVLLGTNSMAISNSTLKITGQYRYDYAKQVLDIVNQERAKVNKPALKMTKELFETANQRSAELVVMFSHARPDESSCTTAFPSENTVRGENIAMGQSSPESVMNSWMNSEGHKKNILGISQDYSTIGIGCFEKNGKLYWTQCFGDTGTTMTSYPTNQTKTVTVPIVPGSTNYEMSKTQTVAIRKNVTLTIKGTHEGSQSELTFDCDNKDFTWVSENEEVATVKNGIVTAKMVGQTKITATIEGTTLDCLVTVTSQENEKNDLTIGNKDIITTPETPKKDNEQVKTHQTTENGEKTLQEEQKGQNKTENQRKLDDEPRTGI